MLALAGSPKDVRVEAADNYNISDQNVTIWIGLYHIYRHRPWMGHVFIV